MFDFHRGPIAFQCLGQNPAHLLYLTSVMHSHLIKYIGPGKLWSEAFGGLVHERGLPQHPGWQVFSGRNFIIFTPSRLCPSVLTLVLHHSVMHSQQNRWPQGVAVVCLRSSKHKVQREWCPALFSLLLFLINKRWVLFSMPVRNIW